MSLPDDASLKPRLRAAVVVAHPDDETLWCGGYILTHPEFLWRIVTLCRAMDADRAPKFRQVLQRFGAEGEMADWIQAQTGQPRGRDWQTWSAAMYLYAAECVEQQSTPFFGEMRGVKSERGAAGALRSHP